jgi:hypothetical protein
VVLHRAAVHLPLLFDILLVNGHFGSFGRSSADDKSVFIIHSQIFRESQKLMRVSKKRLFQSSTCPDVSDANDASDAICQTKIMRNGRNSFSQQWQTTAPENFWQILRNIQARIASFQSVASQTSSVSNI